MAAPPPEKPNKPKEGDSEKPRKELPLISVPDDQALMEEEMADLFEEDRVTHKHGSSEPEAD
jgi:hypothetical protein